MEQYAIKGGNPLVGEVEIGGAKNAALPILAASVMTDETVYIENMPDVRDTNVLLCAMENIGVIVKRTDRHKVTLNASNISEPEGGKQLPLFSHTLPQQVIDEALCLGANDRNSRIAICAYFKKDKPDNARFLAEH